MYLYVQYLLRWKPAIQICRAASRPQPREVFQAQISLKGNTLKAQSDAWFADHITPILAAERRRAVVLPAMAAMWQKLAKAGKLWDRAPSHMALRCSDTSFEACCSAKTMSLAPADMRLLLSRAQLSDQVRKALSAEGLD